MVSGSISIFFFAKEGTNCSLTALKPDICTPIRVPFEKGLGQPFCQPAGTGIDLSFLDEAELNKKGPDEAFPLVIRAEACMTSFGLPMGPFRLQDLVGYEVSIEVGKQFVTAFPERTFKSPLTQLMLENKRAGEKNGKGYYLYDKNRRARPAPEVKEIIEQSIKITQIMPGGKPIVVTEREIVEMIYFPVVNESFWVLDKGVAIQALDLDVSSVLGMGFPAYRDGILFWADFVGAGHIYSSLKKWSESYGGLFKPCAYLEERAARGIPLSVPSAAKKNSGSRL